MKKLVVGTAAVIVDPHGRPAVVTSKFAIPTEFRIPTYAVTPARLKKYAVTTTDPSAAFVQALALLTDDRNTAVLICAYAEENANFISKSNQLQIFGSATKFPSFIVFKKPTITATLGEK